MTDNRLEEIRVRWRRTDLPLTVYSGHVQGDIESLLQVIESLEPGEFICKRCHLRKDSEVDDSLPKF